jgi:hypothetical protein
MAALWFWLGVAGSGVLHGFNPAMGWIFAARDRHQHGGPWKAAWHCLAPLALGHLAALAAGVAARPLLPAAAGLLALVLAVRLLARRSRQMRTAAGGAGLALWAFIFSVAQGAGLAPWLAMPLCAGDAAGNATFTLAAAALHASAMLAAAWIAGLGWTWLRRLALAAGKTRAHPSFRSTVSRLDR